MPLIWTIIVKLIIFAHGKYRIFTHKYSQKKIIIDYGTCQRALRAA